MAQYINQKEFYEEICKCKAQGALTPKALTMLKKMVKEISKVFKYKFEEDREDCQAFAMMDVIRYWDRFDPERSNQAFAYYTSIIKKGMGKGWHKLHPIKASCFISISKENGVHNF